MIALLRAGGHPVNRKPVRRLMPKMGIAAQAESLSHRKERRILSTAEQYLRPLHSACRLAAGSRNRRQTCNRFVGHRQFDRLPPSGHDVTPRLINRKQGIHEQITGSVSNFKESVA
jgi:hypothetical protein